MKTLSINHLFTGLVIMIISIQLKAQVTLDLKVFLEGPFNNTEMNTDLNDFEMLPLNQPYNVSPWNYEVTEQVGSIPNSDIIDWILVELRGTSEGAYSATPSKMIHRQAAFLKTNGQVVGLDGSSLITYSETIIDNLYVIIWHRNHLAVMSSGPLTEAGGTYSWDFTDQISKAFLNGQKELSTGIFGMKSGDSDGSGVVEINDIDPCWIEDAGKQGYFGSDLNLDIHVNNPDKNDYWDPNYYSSSYIPDCGDSITDARDGQMYATVLIGEQCWMAENLNIGYRINGINDQMDNDTIEKYCYGDLETYCDTYGGLFQWDEMMVYDAIPGIQGICPDGWHLPTDEEWKTLEGRVDSQYGVGDPEWDNNGWRGFDVGLNLKSSNSWNSAGNGNDLFNFTALPGGLIDINSNFFNLGNNSNFWTSSMSLSENAWTRDLAHNGNDAHRDTNSKSYGFSVRCIKDSINISNQPPALPSNPQPDDGAININIYTVLSWAGTDPEGDPLNYDVYFGTSHQPGLVSSGQEITSFYPGILDLNTEYYWRIVVHDDHENTTYGEVWSFITEEQPWQCGDTTIDTRDGQKYPTVLIGEQCWMAENLDIGHMLTGNTSLQTDNDTIEKFCFDDDPMNCELYGGLYQWNEMMQYFLTGGVTGICPNGWYLPTDEDWCILEQTVDPSIICDNTGWRGIDGGTRLKQGGTSGFEALMSGLRDFPSGNFLGLSLSSNFWTSDTTNGYNSIFRILGSGSSKVFRTSESKNIGYSVRCLLDESFLNLPPYPPTNPQPPDESQNQDIGIDLMWSCQDPDGDPMIFDIYFDTLFPPNIAISGQADTIFNPGKLIYETEYFWRIVAHDDHGYTVNGDIWSFTARGWACSDTLYDERDGRTYSTLSINSQCWMGENLNIGARINGVIDQLDNDTIEKYCNENFEDSCDVYGGLYQWDEMMSYDPTQGTQGICPPVEGWHIPRHGEWVNLIDSLGGKEIAGGKMKEVGFAHWDTPNTGATNESGFKALAAGTRIDQNGSFFPVGLNAVFWTSYELSQYSGSFFWLSYDSASVWNYYMGKDWGNSIRCVKGEYINSPPNSPSNPQPSNGSTNRPLNTNLSWLCTDPENNHLTYDVYFGTSSNPPLVSYNQSSNNYDPGQLNINTTYRWKIVARDSHLYTKTGQIWSLTTRSWQCGDDMVDSRDNQTYPTVQIGTQCWMGKNMNIGSLLYLLVEQTNNGFIEKWCYNDNSYNDCNTYGGLYDWAEAMQYSTVQGSQGICPNGWHIPTNSEYTTISNFLGGNTIAGGKMKESGTSHWNPPNTGATNSYGFTALPGGMRFPILSIQYTSLGAYCNLWTSSPSETFLMYQYIVLEYDSNDLLNSSTFGSYGYSVRCIKN